MAGRKSSKDSRASAARESRVAAVATEAADPARIRIILLVFGLIVAAICVRLVYLSLVVGPENAAKAEATRTITVEQTAKRGTIYDRNGTVLACDVDATTVYCNPYEVEDADGTATQLADILGGDYEDYYEALTTEDTSFAYLYRKADVDAAEEVEELELAGIYFLEDSRREYPCGSVGGQVIGVCGTDGDGLTGLELYYDDILSGTDGTLVMEQGANGYPIAGGLTLQTDAVDGEDIVISIDIEMQEYLEARLAASVDDIEGDGGNALVYDGSTGEILAMASYPLVDPSDSSTWDDDNMRLTGITDSYEPGSIFKTVSMTAVFEEMDVTTDYEVYCPIKLSADEYYVSDAHSRSAGNLSLRTILANSSNVGMSLICEEMGFETLYEKIVEYNLNDYTGVDYPGESCGYLADYDSWSTIQSYNVSFGQGITVTPLQVARFYGALANDGVECTPHFLISKPQSDKTYVYEEETIIEDQEVIDSITSMLQSVVSDGTGTDAQIDGYSPAGKTGTAEIAGDDGSYIDGYYNISFVGYLPETNSDLVCFVGVTNVPGDRTTTAAFKDIMTFAINHYEITPE